MKVFPFAAIVGQDKLKRALMICAVNQAVGGLLVRGDKGTAKSTAARALTQVMPPVILTPGCKFNCVPGQPTSLCEVCNQEVSSTNEMPAPFVNLPLGATEDRVIGSLDFERALKEGRKAFQPGLLASANRGVLYIDEVNLLADHLVDSLLDAAAMGENHIQRDGLSFSHPAHITLIGTMNPEEGDLRPQLLDRFGIMVEVIAPQDSQTRTEVVRRRMAFENDGERFCSDWQSENQLLKEQIKRAQVLLPSVTLSEPLLNLISTICCELGVASLRADIVMNKVARTLAALDGRTQVHVADIREAAELALPHRKRLKPTDKPGVDDERLDSLLKQAELESENSDEPPPTNDDGESNDSSNGEASEQTFAAVKPDHSLKIEMKGSLATRSAGKRTSAIAAARGQFVRAVQSNRPTNLAIKETIYHSIIRTNGKLEVAKEDLHEQVKIGKNGSLIIFVVDASGSMAALKRMEILKGTAIALLDDVYQRRDKVAVISFRGEKAEVVVSPTRNVATVQEKLTALPTGGRTPLTSALHLVAKLVGQYSAVQYGEPLIILMCDGKANVSVQPDVDAWQETLETASELAQKAVPFIVADTEVGFLRFNRARELADKLNADYVVLQDLSAEDLTLKIRSRLRVNSPRAATVSGMGAKF
jgi:magnesium chelatase subunit D